MSTSGSLQGQLLPSEGAASEGCFGEFVEGKL
eukprot:CAMPEP_0179139410 /NCGR_PEP_ID=MMETSP0796-20121207/66681_1 /TAXON_ID=73915 /ORGANISM="Pyrodinium bahamense, Strain pbaha01" /LENGTH=31 /DNA_ID= /DNA_START= /DNA_END= /DNA_ORIENTATION=